MKKIVFLIAFFIYGILFVTNHIDNHFRLIISFIALVYFLGQVLAYMTGGDMYMQGKGTIKDNEENKKDRKLVFVISLLIITSLFLGVAGFFGSHQLIGLK